MCYVMGACDCVQCIYNYFASNDGKSLVLVELTRLMIVSEPKQWTQTWSQRTVVNFSFLRGKESNTSMFLLNHIIFNSWCFNLWFKLHLKNLKFLFAFKTFYDETKRFLSYQICYLKRNLQLIVVWSITKETFLFYTKDFFKRVMLLSSYRY